MDVSKLSNIISTSLICMISYPIIRFVLTLDLSYIVMLVGILFTDLLTKMIKSIIKRYNNPDNIALSNILIRPKGACDCDILNQNGCQEGKPGMPSGHMAVTIFFLFYLYYNYYCIDNSNYNNKIIYIVAAFLYAVSMGYARYSKQCHNIMQIIVGSIVGIVCATFLKFIYL